MNLYYIHDPMCSWCYAFKPILDSVKSALIAKIKIQPLVGGLAKDSDQPMPEETRRYVQEAWKRISVEVPGTTFNFEFWNQCQPRRSTYPACRAVLLARDESAQHEEAMINAIQQAYYQNAQNPSDTDVLCQLAEDLGLDARQFSAQLNSAETQSKLDTEIAFTRSIGASSFPSIILVKNSQPINIPLSYNDAEFVISGIETEIQ